MGVYCDPETGLIGTPFDGFINIASPVESSVWKSLLNKPVNHWTDGRAGGLGDFHLRGSYSVVCVI